MTRDQLVAEARTLIGTPYHHQACLRGVGIDCIGVLRWVARAFGLPHKMPASYSRWPRHGQLRAGLAQYLSEVPVADMQPGDALLFSYELPEDHVGIATEHGFIHSYADQEKVEEVGLDDCWRGRIRGVFRFPGVES